MRLIPVPRGMCPAFYEFMGAGCPRREDGQIMMLASDQDDDEQQDEAAARTPGQGGGDG